MEKKKRIRRRWKVDRNDVILCAEARSPCNFFFFPFPVRKYNTTFHLIEVNQETVPKCSPVNKGDKAERGKENRIVIVMRSEVHAACR